MNRLFFEKNQSYLLFQRNIFAGVAFLLVIALIIQSTFLFLKQERIVIVPPVTDREFWVEANRISPTYLEQFGCFLSQLILAKSSHSAEKQRSVLLRHTAPEYLGVLKQRLIEEEEVLKKQNAAYVFYPIDIKADIEQMSLHLRGERFVYIGGKEVSKESEGYILRFSYSGSRLLLKEIQAEKSEQGS